RAPPPLYTLSLHDALPISVLLSGRITDDQTGAGLGGIAVNVTDSTTHCCPFGNISFGSTAPDGSYHVLAPKGIPVKINFFPFGRSEEHTSELQSRVELVCR